jgi:hypothetical protein
MNIDTLVPLPPPAWTPVNRTAGFAWSEDQMLAYAAQAVASERERLRVLVEAVRDANAAASLCGDSWHLCNYSQRVAWVRLMDALDQQSDEPDIPRTAP